MQKNKNRNALIQTALKLFRRHGYAGVGVSEILLGTGLPKGSLYYHFPGGKLQLAEEAIRSADIIITEKIMACFTCAVSFSDGAVALCREVSRLAVDGKELTGCPVMSVAQAVGGEENGLQKTIQDVLAGWTNRIADHATRLGVADSKNSAALLLMSIEGAWLIARVQQSTAPFETLERYLVGKP